MRSFQQLTALAAAAALFAVVVAGCKYSQTYPPLPGPSLAPTLAPGVVTEFPLTASPNATPFAITAGNDGNMWFTELNTAKVGRVTPTGAITEVPLAGGSLPEDIIQGPPGNPNIWFVESGTSKIGVVNESTMTLAAEFPTTTPNAGPAGIAVDASGNLWFGEFSVGNVAKITAGGIITEYSVSATFAGATPDAVAVTPDGRIWFLDLTNNAVGSLTFPGPTVNEYPIPSAGSLPEEIVFNAVDGNLWFTEGSSGNVAKVIVSTSPPTIVEYPLPSNTILTTAPFGIATSNEDNDVWVAEAAAGQVARVTTSGAITEYGIPGLGTTAVGVAAGPDVVSGAKVDLWFTDSNVVGSGSGVGTNQIGKINLGAIPASGWRKPLSQTARKSVMRIPIHGPLMGLH